MKYSIREIYTTLEMVCMETGSKLSLYHSDEVLSFTPQYSAEGEYEELELEYKRYAGAESVTMRGTFGLNKSGHPDVHWYYKETPKKVSENGPFKSPVDINSKIWGINLGDFMRAVETVNNQLLWQQKKLEKMMKIYDRFANADESED